MPDPTDDDHRDVSDAGAYTPEEIRILLDEAMDECYALCPAEPMTPAKLDEMVETMRRIARREQ